VRQNFLTPSSRPMVSRYRRAAWIRRNRKR
jgi:hypothetical protein